jgi:hypothetical protein
VLTGRVVLLVALGLGAAGCATGSRPSFGEGAATTVLGGDVGTPVGDAAVDTVLGRLEQPAGPDFTAHYQLVRRLGDVHADATVVRHGEDMSVTIGDTRFLLGDQPQTCTVSTGACVDGTLDQRVSDTGISSTFWSPGPARALRVAYARRTGGAQPASQQVGGQTVQCVDIPLGEGTERYCATALGPVAVWSTADKQVELVSMTDTADVGLLGEPAGPPTS